MGGLGTVPTCDCVSQSFCPSSKTILFNSPRSERYEKCPPINVNDDRSSVLRNATYFQPSWAQAPQRAPILDQIAKTYGIDSWDKLEAIRYTWNGEITGLFKAAASGSGSLRPARLLLKARAKIASRSRLRTTVRNSAANLTR